MQRTALIAAVLASLLALPVFAKRAFREVDPKEESANKKERDGDFKGAIADLREVADTRPNDFRLRMRLATLLETHENADAAIAQWSEYLALPDIAKSHGHLFRADLRLLKPDLRGAIDDCAAAAEATDKERGRSEEARAKLWAVRVIAGEGEAADKEAKKWYEGGGADGPVGPRIAFMALAAGTVDEKGAATMLPRSGEDLSWALPFYGGIRMLRAGKTAEAREKLKKCLELAEKAGPAQAKSFECRAAVVALRSLDVE
ncbi:MAG: hypothetical protein FD180_367 [Planctomycetota bacterium]|nr:MAG: hypothetical protein FD180_367 [Planctomycetota bacterium]